MNAGERSPAPARTPPPGSAAELRVGGRPDSSSRSLWGRLLADPCLVAGLVAVGLLIALAANDDGYPQTHWAPVGIVLLALLAIVLCVVGPRAARMPSTVKLAIGALVAYTALSFLSILWAKVKGDAWEGADRTLLYLIVFTLFAAWRRPASSAAALLAAWVLAMAGLAAFTVVHVDDAASSLTSLATLMPGGRLVFPAGYTNANAAMWMMPAFAALILASTPRIHWLGRGLLAGCSVLLAGVALYSQSRGSVFSAPIVLALVFIFLPGRVRTFATLVPVAAGVAALTPAVLRLDERVEARSPAAAAAHSATLSVAIAAVAVAALVAVFAGIERRARVSAQTERRVHRSIAVAGVVALIALVAGGIVLVGNPVAKAEHEWRTFTSQRGYAADEVGKSRLISGLGSSRSDFYRVAWHEFVEHPLLGIGVDNFAVPYLRLRHSQETPHYPHSIELRTLAETGIVGLLIALVGLGAALLATRRALLATDRLGVTVAAAVVAGFAYWIVHGSFDWLFEYAGLGVAAFFLLGLACSLSPPADARILVRAPSGTARRDRARAVAIVAGSSVVVLALVAALALPWLSRLEVENAARIWPGESARAYASLDLAAQLNPLGEEPDVIAGTIALRLDQLARAERAFKRALQRSPDESYATLELGAIASTRGQRARAIRLLAKAVSLDPRYALSREALASARAGRTVEVAALNRSILLEAQQFS